MSGNHRPATLAVSKDENGGCVVRDVATKVVGFGRFAGSAALGFALAMATAAPADAVGDKVYTIGNYPVEASAASAVVAKDKALAEGQQAAFRSLLKRIVPVTSYEQLSRVTSASAADLVSGFSVRSERNSSTDYIASLDFNFYAPAVRALLQREGIPFIDDQAASVTIVPVLRQGNPPVAKADTSLWRRSWAGLDLTHTVTPVTVADLKPVIHADTIKMLMEGDDNGLRILTQEYATSLVVLAIVEPDMSGKSMVVTLTGQDAVGPLLLKRTYRISDGDVAYASELAAVVALGVLEGRWKAVKGGMTANAATPAALSDVPVWAATAGTSGDPVRVVVEFDSPAQWNDMRAQLLDTSGVEGMEIATLSARNAEVSMRFPGGAAGLAKAVGGRGLSLASIGEVWVLRSANY